MLYTCEMWQKMLHERNSMQIFADIISHVPVRRSPMADLELVDLYALPRETASGFVDEDSIELPPGAMSLEFLQAIYRSPEPADGAEAQGCLDCNPDGPQQIMQRFRIPISQLDRYLAIDAPRG
jgi:hypothetical protein